VRKMRSTQVRSLSICGTLMLTLLCSQAASCWANQAASQANSSALEKSIQQMALALKAQDANSAEEIGRKLLATHPRDARLLVLYGIALKMNGNFDQAESALQNAVQFAPHSLPAIEALAELEYNAKRKNAESTVRRLLQMQPENQTAHAMLAMTLYREHKFTEAVAEFRSLNESITSQPDLAMSYGVALAQCEQWDAAVARFRALLAALPQNEDVRYDLALALWKNHASAEALSTLQPSIAEAKTRPVVLRLAAAIHEDREETPEAVELLRRAIQAEPTDAGNYVEFAILASKHNSFDVGIDMLNRGLAVAARKSPLYMSRGVLYGQSGEYDKAMADFEQVHAIDPGFSLTATAEGIALSQRHDHGAALANFRRQVHEHPEDALGHYLLAEAISWTPADGATLSADSLKESIAEVNLALKLDSKMVQAYDLSATLNLQAEMNDAAIAACKRALEIDANDQQALYSLILALRKNDDKEALKPLVKRLMEVRKASTQREQQARYGRLIIAGDESSK